MRKRPRMDEFLRAMENLRDAERRKMIALKAGEIYEIGSIFVQIAGVSVDQAKEFIEASTIKGNLPEPLRIAHLAASAIIHGESKGKA